MQLWSVYSTPVHRFLGFARLYIPLCVSRPALPRRPRCLPLGGGQAARAGRVQRAEFTAFGDGACHATFKLLTLTVTL